MNEQILMKFEIQNEFANRFFLKVAIIQYDIKHEDGAEDFSASSIEAFAKFAKIVKKLSIEYSKVSIEEKIKIYEKKIHKFIGRSRLELALQGHTLEDTFE